jgi:CRP-like cAMP-binding protein
MNGAILRPQPAAGGPRRFEALMPLTVVSRCLRGQEICCQGEPADRWFWIIAGTARRRVIRPDGRRHIVDLLLPGDCSASRTAPNMTTRSKR